MLKVYRCTYNNEFNRPHTAAPPAKGILESRPHTEAAAPSGLKLKAPEATGQEQKEALKHVLNVRRPSMSLNPKPQIR